MQEESEIKRKSSESEAYVVVPDEKPSMENEEKSEALPSHIMVVDSDKHYSAEEDRFWQFLKHWKLQTCPKYSVASIMGAQSGGKSTLMNMVFGTHFETMDATRGRQQTTRGIWMAGSPKVPDLLIMDLEGTDSAEKGEDRLPFERQSALFAMALSSVLMINMWYHDIGRYAASNVGVLKTIFEVNLKLFSGGEKTTLMFIVRDYDENETPVEAIQKKLTDTVEKIWSEISKPEKFEEMSAHDLFDLEFQTFPHFKYRRGDFDEAVVDMHNRFVDPSCQRFLRGKQHHFTKTGFPSDGLWRYMQQIWESVLHHKDLNLPSQREMLSIYRCDEFVSDCVTRFATELDPLRCQMQKEFVPSFVVQAVDVVQTSLEAFDHNSEQYDIAVVEKKRTELRVKLHEELQKLYEMQLSHVRRESLKSFTNSLQQRLPSSGAADDFSALAKTCRDETVEAFVVKCAECAPTKLRVTWSCDDAKRELLSDLDAQTENARRAQVKALQSEIERLLRSSFAQPLAQLFLRGDSSVWHQVVALKTKCAASVQSVLKKITGLSVSDQERATLDKDVAAVFTQLLTDEGHKLVTYIKTILHKKFDSIFRLEPDGVPRKWGVRDDVRAVFKRARDEALALLETLSCMPSSEEFADAFGGVEDGDKTIMDLASRMELEERFKHEIAGALAEAEMVQERLKQQSSLPPWWMLLMFAYFAYDDILEWMYNPLSSFFILLLLVAAGGVTYMGMWGPVMQFAAMFADRAKQKGEAAMRQYATQLTQSATPSPPSASASVEMSSLSKASHSPEDDKKTR